MCFLVFVVERSRNCCLTCCYSGASEYGTVPSLEVVLITGFDAHSVLYREVVRSVEGLFYRDWYIM